MNFKFNNSIEAAELVSRLRLGQTIKIEVLDKIEHNKFKIRFKGLVLSAVSEVDLTSKSCWLKVTQLTPFPKLQIIIEEQSGYMNDLLSYADENDLDLPHIPNSLKINIETYPTRVNAQELYDFISLYSEWSGISNVLLNLKNFNFSKDGITISDLNRFFSSYNIEKNENNNSLKSSKLLFSEEDIDIESAKQKNIYKNLKIITKINNNLKNTNFKLALYMIENPKYCIILPVECEFQKNTQSITGLIKTKHFGKILYKGELPQKLILSFENSIYMNAIKPLIKNTSTQVFFSIQKLTSTNIPNSSEVSLVV